MLEFKKYRVVFTNFQWIVIGFSLAICACQTKTREDNSTILAKAYDKTLSINEVQSLLGPNMTKQDSFFFIKEYIDNWVQKQVILNNAQQSDIGSTDEIGKKVEDYKNDLIMYEYRKKMISEKLDTNISIAETKEYYNNHPENFELKQNIIRFVFIKMPVSLEKKHNFWSKFGNADDEAITNMAVVALKSGGSAFLDKNKWLAFDDILKVVPINTYDQEDFINNNTLFKIDETNFIWFIHILEFKIKDTVSPFEFVKENITQILLNKRKVNLMEKLENNLVNKAKKADKIKIYLPKYE
ncbi:MAG: hypothetical protein NT034_01320 [Candidatus Magasanikbacteria bacterium]|nr:hypothetical protein [Candidatus Magasanikbacteria bacterium]